MTVIFLDRKMKKQDESTRQSSTDSVSIHREAMPVPPEGVTTSSTPVQISYKIPNKDTIEAIQEIEEGDVINCEDEDDFFQKLRS